MTATAVALVIIGGIVALGSAAGFYAGSRYKMDLEQWTVAGRGLGLVFVWLLMAGEIYTAFTFLGASGWAYSRGAPALYILGYQPLCYLVSFYILPQIWDVGHKHGMQTLGDFFHVRYGGKYLAPLVAIMGVVCIVPYLQLQLTGLGIIAEVASFGAIGHSTAIVIASAIVASFVFFSGVRGIAWVSVLKDLLLLFAAFFVGLAIPYIYFGGIGPMFAELVRVKPSHLTMPGATSNLGHSWYISTLLLTALGFYMWPQSFSASFTAKNADTLRRNAVLMPFYSITMPLMFFVGLAALLVVPGLTSGDLSLLTMVRKTFPPWFLGIVGGTGALTAMVPAAVQVLSAATLFTKNVYRPLLARKMSDHQIARTARIMVVLMMSLAVASAVSSSLSLVSLLLLGYAGVTQFFPGVIFGLYSYRTSRAAIGAGLATGFGSTALMVFTRNDPIMGVNAGFIGLCMNFLVVLLVRLFASSPPGNPLYPPAVAAQTSTAD
jgi:SSS family solute:Na+ symporter